MVVSKRKFGSLRASDGERKATREGAQARREGYQGRNPYTTTEGEPIPAFRKLAAAWQRGYDAGE
jgi:hypothetical protein